MATPRPERSTAPDLEATDARQARPAPAVFLVLIVSTVVGAVVVALVWAFFAGPLHHAPQKPQVTSPGQASTFNEPAPPAKLAPAGGGASPAAGGTGQPQ